MVVVLIALLTYVANDWRSDRVIRSVVVRGITLADSSEVARQARVLGDTLRRGELDEYAIRKVVERLSFVRSAVVGFERADVLAIEVQEYKPIAYVTFADGDVGMVSEEGTSLPMKLHPVLGDMPVVVSGGVSAAVPDTAKLRRAAEFLSSLRAQAPEVWEAVSEFHLRTDSTVVLLTADVSVPILAGLYGEKESTIIKLKRFWTTQQVDLNLRKYRSIDLRWSNQVVVRYQV